MKQRLIPVACLLALTAVCALAACTAQDERETTAEPETTTAEETVTETVAETDTTAETEQESESESMTEAETTTNLDSPVFFVSMKGEERPSFVVMYDHEGDPSASSIANDIVRRAHNVLGTTLRVMDAANQSNVRDKEIVIGSATREETVRMTAELKDGEYAIDTLVDENAGVYKVFIAYKGHFAAQRAVMTFLEECMSEDGLAVPFNYQRRGSVNTSVTPMIETNIDCLRDPCIVIVDGVYYAYGTGWVCYKNTSGHLDGAWEFVGKVAENPPTDLGTDHWAPEVHVYNGAYYMFTTYISTDIGHHGCTILRSESPEGPFVEITNGVITPRDWDAIDGTLYVDPDGQPWMVFVREWVSAPNNVGTFAAAKLSEDLTHFISEPFELFSADEPHWNKNVGLSITDGCWLYTTAEGKLLCLWSNFNADGYVVAIAESSNGRLDGQWSHQTNLLYCKAYTGVYDGGHGMIFTDTDGQKYLSFHSPNAAVGSRLEKPVFIPLTERNGKLTWSIFAE